MKKLLIISLLLFGFISNAQQLLFPSAYGAGAYNTAGRGQTVYHVTTLDFNDSVGSFKWAFETAMANNGGTIVFDVSGVIEISGSNGEWRYHALGSGVSDTRIFSNISILGQTAPYPGITLDTSNAHWEVVEGHNILLRYLKFRASGDKTFMNWQYCDYIVMDHCSLAWGKSGATNVNFGSYTDYNLDGSGYIPSNFTIQYNFFAHSGRATNLGNTSGNVNAPFGDVSIHRNVYTNMSYRTALKTGGDGRYDIINNLIYFKRSSKREMRFDNMPFKLNHIGNYYSSGIAITGSFDSGSLHKIWTTRLDTDIQIYNDDNDYSPSLRPADFDTNKNADWDAFRPNGSEGNPDIPSSWFVDIMHPLNGRALPIIPRVQVQDSILYKVGANKYINDNAEVVEFTDHIDTRYKNDISTDNLRSAEMRPENRDIGLDYTSNTRPVNFYQSNAHIPEAYFIANGITGTATIHNEVQPSGYTMLEEYANMVDGPQTPIEEPSITLIGNSVIELLQNSEQYVEQGATAFDEKDGDITNSIVIAGDTVDETTVGTYIITYNVTDTDNNSAIEVTRTVNVNPLVNVTDVNVLPNTVDINQNESDNLAVTFTPSNPTDTTGTWLSSDTNIATVDSNGEVTGVTQGTVSITFTSNDGGFSDSSNVTIVEQLLPLAPILNSVVLSGTDFILTWSQPSGSFIPDNYDTVIDGVDLQDHASYNDNDLTRTITGLDTTVSHTFEVQARFASLDDNYDDLFPESNLITYTPNASSVDVTDVVFSNESTANVKVGGSTALTAVFIPSNSTDQTGVWSSTNSNVATVDQSGNVSYVGIGQATITFSSNEDNTITASKSFQITALNIIGTVKSKKQLLINN